MKPRPIPKVSGNPETERSYRGVRQMFSVLNQESLKEAANHKCTTGTVKTAKGAFKWTLDVIGWVLLSIFLVSGVIGTFPLNSLDRLGGFVIWSGSLAIWLIVGWLSIAAWRNRS